MKARRFYLLVSAALLLLSGPVMAQSYRDNPLYGETLADRDATAVLLSNLRGAINEKDYNRAAGYVNQLVASAPRASQNTYIFGALSYLNKFQKATTPAQRQVMLDSLLWIHDKRIEAFGSHPQQGERYIRTRKALDMLQLAASDPRFVGFAQEAFAAGSTEPNLAVRYFQTLVTQYQAGNLTAEELLNRYTFLAAHMEKATEDKAQEARDAIEALLATSGAADCQMIERIFKPQYEADPSNIELAQRILALLYRAKCTSPFYMELLERHYAANPTPELALQLASTFQNNGNPAKALEYMRVALDGEQDPEKKANYLLQAAGMALGTHAYRDAAGFARQVIALDGENGFGYYFLANALAGGASSACGGDFERRTVYWLVVDNLAQARKFLPADDPRQEDIGRMIGNMASGQQLPGTERNLLPPTHPGARI